MIKEKRNVLATIKKHNFLIIFSITFLCACIFLGLKAVKDAGILGSNTDVLEIETTTEAEEVTTMSQEEDKTYTFEKVDLSYLDDALFIGDSRTVLLQKYANWENVDFYVGVGFQIWGIMDSKIKLQDGQEMTVNEALANNSFNKIYIQLGVNELGRGTDKSFCEQYSKVIEQIKQLQPDAIIFLQSIMHVSEIQDSKQTYVNNGVIDSRNAELKKLADNKTVFWLDANSVFDEGDSGKLNPDYTSDGIHLKANCVDDWENFLLEHGIVK